MTTRQNAIKRLAALKLHLGASQATLAGLNKEMKGAIKDISDIPELAHFRTLPDQMAKRMEDARKKGNSEEQGMRIVSELKEQLKKQNSAA